MRVVVDLGGVAARFQPDRRLARLAQLSGLSPLIVHDRIWGSGLDDRASRGELTRDETYERVLAALAGRVDEAQLREAWALAFVPDPAVLERYRGAALLTNNGPILEDCLPPDVRAAFDPVLVSWRLGACKPDARVFSAVSELLGDDLHLVDDEEANVEAARAAGWTAELFTGG